MEIVKAKKLIIPISILIVILGVIIIISLSNNSNTQESDLVEQQKYQITTFFKENKAKLNQIKDSLWNNKYSIREIRRNGFVELEEGSDVWLPDISSIIKEIYTKGEKCNIRYMEYGELTNKFFGLEAFFPENNMEIDIIFSEMDLTKNSGMYSHLEDNWYLFVGGMT